MDEAVQVQYPKCSVENDKNLRSGHTNLLTTNNIDEAMKLLTTQNDGVPAKAVTWSRPETPDHKNHALKGTWDGTVPASVDRNNQNDRGGAEHKYHQRKKSTTSVLYPLQGFGWVNKYSIRWAQDEARDSKVATSTVAKKDKVEGEYRPICPQGKALEHPAAPFLRLYAQKGCPVNVGRSWTRHEIIAAAKKGPNATAKKQM